MTCTDSPDCPCAVCAWVYGPAPEPQETTVLLTRESSDPERYGAGVCVTGLCIEPCGDNGGCKR